MIDEIFTWIWVLAAIVLVPAFIVMCGGMGGTRDGEGDVIYVWALLGSGYVVALAARLIIGAAGLVMGAA